ncbi:MAG: hypothetical protein V4609_06295 [Pseudomonadota bacterium]
MLGRSCAAPAPTLGSGDGRAGKLGVSMLGGKAFGSDRGAGPDA